MTSNNPAEFTFGDVVKAPKSGGNDGARMDERRAIAGRIIDAAGAGIADVEDGNEVVVNISEDTAKRHTAAQISRAINDTLGDKAFDGPFYSRSDKASGTVRIVKGKRPRRKSEAGRKRNRAKS